MFDPVHDITTFANLSMTAVFKRTSQLIHMRKRLPEPNCEILLTYNSAANHANDYAGNDYMNITFMYPSTLPADLIKPMMQNALMRHQYLLWQMRRWCNVKRIYVHQRENNIDESVTRTRGMLAKYNANTYQIFADRAGWWGVSFYDSKTQFYHPVYFDHRGFPCDRYPDQMLPEPPADAMHAASLDA